MNEWFGQVRWCEEDLINALEVQNYPVTENNIAKLRAACEGRGFTEFMVQAGWEFMYNTIGNDDSWDEYEEDEDNADK